jgi:hypothetical protein
VADPRRLPALAWVLVAAELGTLLGPEPVRIPAGLTLGLILPGLVITRLLIGPRSIGRLELLALVPGVGVSVAVITGLTLDIVHVPLTTVSWALSLGLVTGAGIAVTAIPAGESRVAWNPPRPSPWPTPASPGRPVWRSIGPTGMFVLAAVAVGCAISVSAIGQGRRDARTQFTELWALPGSRAAPGVRLGVQSHQSADVRYGLRVSVDGRVVRSEPLALKPGQTWQATQRVAGSGRHVDVALLTSPRGRIYREVHVTTG